MVQPGIEDIKKRGKGWKEIQKVRFLEEKEELGEISSIIPNKSEHGK
jgi:hypothetical protein